VHTSQHGNILKSTLGNLIVEKGAIGVQLFFLASSFTLFLSFSKRSMVEKFPIRNFFIRRFFRIAPIFYLGIGYYLFQNWHSGRNIFTPSIPHAVDVFLNFSFLNGFNPYSIRSIVPGGWSIAVEVTFYALLPFLFSKIKSEKQAFDFFVIALLLRVLFTSLMQKFHLIADVDVWNVFLFLNFVNQLPVFALGILFYFLVTKPPNRNFNFNPIIIILFSLISIIQLSVGIPFFLPEHILFSIFFILFALALNFKQPIYLVNRIINYIGTISFSMYIIHFAVLYWLTYFHKLDYFNNQFLNLGFKFLLINGFTILLATITYNFIEMPFQNIGKKIIDLFEKRNNA
jgi:peptidoglycan/LPS O-acetylase OafA/YrhL